MIQHRCSHSAGSVIVNTMNQTESRNTTSQSAAGGVCPCAQDRGGKPRGAAVKCEDVRVSRLQHLLSGGGGLLKLKRETS